MNIISGIPNYDFVANNLADRGPYALSCDSNYIPIAALKGGTVYKTKNTKTLMYNFYEPKKYDVEYRYSAYYYLFKDFIGHSTHYIGKKDITDDGVIMWSMPGVIGTRLSGVHIPLICLCVKSERLFDLTKDNLDSSNLVLVVNKAILLSMFTDLKDYFNTSILVKPEFLSIEVIYTDDIMSNCYNLVAPEKEYNTIADMIADHNSTNEILMAEFRKNYMPVDPFDARRLERTNGTSNGIEETRYRARPRRRFGMDIELIDDTESNVPTTLSADEQALLDAENIFYGRDIAVDYGNQNVSAIQQMMPVQQAYNDAIFRVEAELLRENTQSTGGFTRNEVYNNIAIVDHPSRITPDILPFIPVWPERPDNEDLPF